MCLAGPAGPACPADENERNMENFLFLTQMEIYQDLVDSVGENLANDCRQSVIKVLRKNLRKLKDEGTEAFRPDGGCKPPVAPVDAYLPPAPLSDGHLDKEPVYKYETMVRFAFEIGDAQYARGLKAGRNDRDDQADAWEAVTKTLSEVAPSWWKGDRSGMETVCAAIRELATKPKVVYNYCHDDDLVALRNAAVRTLTDLNYSYNIGANQWQPPAGEKPKFSSNVYTAKNRPEGFAVTCQLGAACKLAANVENPFIDHHSLGLELLEQLQKAGFGIVQSYGPI